MSSVRLHVDEYAGETAVIAALRAWGVDQLTTLEAGRLGSSDADQLVYATQQGRAIYTLNASDFARLHREVLQAGGSHAGIVVIPEQRYSVGENG
ncbi:MAG: DUF5615 family PIN-like protein [Pirellulaceae bacterium]